MTYLIVNALKQDVVNVQKTVQMHVNVERLLLESVQMYAAQKEYIIFILFVKVSIDPHTRKTKKFWDFVKTKTHETHIDGS